MAQPVKVLVTGAAGQIAYSLMHSIANGDMLGKEQPVILHLLDITPMLDALKGVEMELQDCALPLLKKVVVTDSLEVAFADIDVAVLAGAMPRKEGMERKDLLAANVKIFKTQGAALDNYAKKTVKVVVVGNPANTNALICQQNAPSIPKENFTCLTRLDQNRAQAQIAARAGVSVSDVQNVIIWGNHSSTQYPDVSYSTVFKNGVKAPTYDVVQDENWLHNAFIQTVQQRGAAVIKARKLSSAMSAAKAIVDHVRDWWFGTGPDRVVSMGVISDGNSYGVPSGLVYSFPLRIAADRTWSIVSDLPVSDFARAKIDATAAELVDERDQALAATQ